MRYLLVLISCFSVLWSCNNNPTQIIRHEPVIHSIELERTIVYVSETVGVSANVSDADENDKLTFRWNATGGGFVSEKNNPTQWRAPNSTGKFTLTLVVSDGFYETSKNTEITVKNR